MSLRPTSHAACGHLRCEQPYLAGPAAPAPCQPATPPQTGAMRPFGSLGRASPGARFARLHIAGREQVELAGQLSVGTEDAQTT